MTSPSSAPPTGRPLTVAVIIASLAGALVSLSLGAYAHIHSPTAQPLFDLGSHTMLELKVWLASIATALAVTQLFSALWMYGKLPWPPRPAVSVLHRWTGTAAFVVSLPVAYHCLWALGFQDQTVRTLNHSVLGCVFYGVFTTKMILLRVRRAGSWLIPIVGGILFTVLIGVWLTSALWYFQYAA